MRRQDRVFIAKGDITATMYDKKTGIEEVKKWHNVIVDVASELMAELMKENSGVQGIMTLAVGTGGIGWDLQNPPPATAAQTQLEAELIRKTFASTNYVDSLGNPTVTRTNIVDYITTFNETEAVGALVEMGLFGGTGSTTPGAGTQCNYHVFPVWNKNNTSTLTINWRLTF